MDREILEKHETIKATYVLAEDRRPWVFEVQNVQQVMEMVEKWLKERGGVVIYENITLDSSHMGERNMIPAIFESEKEGFVCAPTPRWNKDGNFSTEMQQVDFIHVDQFEGKKMQKAMENFRIIQGER